VQQGPDGSLLLRLLEHRSEMVEPPVAEELPQVSAESPLPSSRGCWHALAASSPFQAKQIDLRSGGPKVRRAGPLPPWQSGSFPGCSRSLAFRRRTGSEWLHIKNARNLHGRCLFGRRSNGKDISLDGLRKEDYVG
jgi:hypothetical protein